MSVNEEILINITPEETRVAIVDNGALQVRADVRLLAMNVDGLRVPMQVYGKVTAVRDGTVTLRFTSILLGETEKYYTSLLDLPAREEK